MDIVKIYTNKQNMMDLNTAKKSILSIAKKFHLNHLDLLNECPTSLSPSFSSSFTPSFSQSEKEKEKVIDHFSISCEIQIEPFLDSECQVDFEKSKREFTEYYGRQYAYFEKQPDTVELKAFIVRLKRECADFTELGQLYKILSYQKQKYAFAKSQGVSIAKEIYEEIIWLRKNVLKLLPGCPLREIDYKFHFDTNNRAYRLKELNRQQLIIFDENKHKNSTNLLKQISTLNLRLDFLFKLPDPSKMELNETDSLKKKLIILEKDLKKIQDEKFKKFKYLPEEKIEIEKKKIIIEENKKCGKLIAKSLTSFHSEENIRGVQRFAEDPEYFNEGHYLKIGFFFPAMASFKKNEEEKYIINKCIESECQAFKIKNGFEYNPSSNMSPEKKKIDELYDQLKNLHKNESYPDMQAIFRYCETYKVAVKDVVKF